MQLLQRKYAPSLRRDPTFDGYLEQIASKFYGIRPNRPQMGGFLGKMMESMFADQGKQ
jgi:hypothetical protein